MRFRFTCEVVISLPLITFGLVGNSLAFNVLTRQDQRQHHKGPASCLLQALAVTDTLILILSILLRSVRYWHYCLGGFSSYMAVYGYVFCSTYPVVCFLRLFNVWITVILTVERYVAVSHPFLAQRWCSLTKTYLYIKLLCVISLLFSLPRFFEFKVNSEKTSDFTYTDLVNTKPYTVFYRIIAFFLVMYLVPMTMMLILNCALWRALRKAFRTRASIRHTYSSTTRVTTRNDTNTNQLDQCVDDHPVNYSGAARSSVTVMVSVAVLIRILCQALALVSHLLWSLTIAFNHLQHLEKRRRYISNISNVFSNLNCSVNFVVYCLCSKQFRHGLHDAVCGRCKQSSADDV